MRRGGGIGLVLLVIVVAIVLWLVAQNWKQVAPTALEVSNPGTAADDHGETGAGEALRSGEMPRLNDARDATDAHADDVQNALDAIE